MRSCVRHSRQTGGHAEIGRKITWKANKRQDCCGCEESHNARGAWEDRQQQIRNCLSKVGDRENVNLLHRARKTRRCAAERRRCSPAPRASSSIRWSHIHLCCCLFSAALQFSCHGRSVYSNGCRFFHRTVASSGGKAIDKLFISSVVGAQSIVADVAVSYIIFD